MRGSEHELSFWKDFVKSDRFLNGWLSDEKTPELNDLVYMFLKGQPEAKVLDCGSGVVSILHGTVPSDNLVWCDPLGDEYEKIFDYESRGIFSPVPYACEDLPEDYNDEFDVVHISNAIDHVQQPQQAYERMFDAVRPGGFLIIQGFVNEATHEDWTGFHQQNADLLPNGSFILRGKDGINLIIEDPYISKKIYLDILGREWIIFIKRKMK
jgi:SAM-dependent methyltransferase